jgi:feruloyl esterase
MTVSRQAGPRQQTSAAHLGRRALLGHGSTARGARGRSGRVESRDAADVDDTPLRRSYFDGCSTGGRQGLISAQRFPEDFDGIVVGAPVLNFGGTMISYVMSQRALGAAPIAPEKLKIIADAVYRKCDAVDGVADGLIDDPRRCAFKPSADLPRCAADTDGPACFTGAQLRALETIYGAVKRNGAEVFPGWPVGAEIAPPASGGPPGSSASGWFPWFVGSPNLQPIQISFGETFFKYMAFGKPNPSYDWQTFNVDADLDKLQWTRSVLDATDPISRASRRAAAGSSATSAGPIRRSIR